MNKREEEMQSGVTSTGFFSASAVKQWWVGGAGALWTLKTLEPGPATLGLSSHSPYPPLLHSLEDRGLNVYSHPEACGMKRGPEGLGIPAEPDCREK